VLDLDVSESDVADGFAAFEVSAGMLVLMLEGRPDRIELTTDAREETAGTDAAGRSEGRFETTLLIAETMEDI